MYFSVESTWNYKLGIGYPLFTLPNEYQLDEKDEELHEVSNIIALCDRNRMETLLDTTSRPDKPYKYPPIFTWAQGSVTPKPGIKNIPIHLSVHASRNPRKLYANDLQDM